jgi:hypothetical protein
MGEAVACRVLKAGSDSPDEFRDEAEGANGLRAHTRHAEQALETLRLALVGGEEYLLQALGVHVL